MTTAFEPIKILGIAVDEVGEPRNDGTRGAALYEVPFQLSSDPPSDWCDFFIDSWNHPPRFTTMHRPGIASVIGDRVVLDGTTVDEVERYHRETLVLAVNEANEKYQQHVVRQQRQAEAVNEQRQRHRDDVAARAGKIRFD